MAIPGFQKLMLPLLNILRDCNEHTRHELTEMLAQEFQLSESDRRELISSGAPKFENRVDWARAYLKMAGFIANAERGKFHITDDGLRVLKNPPPEISIRFLKQFPAFQHARNPDQQNNPQEEVEDEPTRPPDEALESIYQNLRRALAQELLERIKKCKPGFFERLVVDLLLAMGYGGSREDAGEAIGRGRDGGIDGIIKEDKLGLDIVYVQAKRWEGTVGRPIVQAFAGSLEGQRARKGVLITTSQFSQDAEDYVTRIDKKIVLIDGERLAQLMIDHGVGVTEVQSYSVKRVDLDYFNEE